MFATPNPFHFAQTCFTGTVVITRRTRIFINNRRRLQAVGKNNIWVHSRDVQVINQRRFRENWVVTEML